MIACGLVMDGIVRSVAASDNVGRLGEICETRWPSPDSLGYAPTGISLCKVWGGITLECCRPACAPEQQRPPQHGKKNGSFERTAFRSRERHSTTKFPLKSNPSRLLIV